MEKEFFAVNEEIFKASRRVSVYLIFKGKKQQLAGRIITRNEPEREKTTVVVDFQSILVANTVRGVGLNREDEALDEIFRECRLDLTHIFRDKSTDSLMHGLLEWKQAFSKAGFTFLQAL